MKSHWESPTTETVKFHSSTHSAQLFSTFIVISTEATVNLTSELKNLGKCLEPDSFLYVKQFSLSQSIRNLGFLQ